MPNYNEVQSAVRVEKFKIWFAWVSGGILVAIITNATKSVSVVTEVAFFVLGVLATIAAFRMTNALNRRADTARKEVLGDL